MSENKICLRLLGLSLAPQPGVTQRYIAKNRPLTWLNVPLTRHHRTRVFSAIEFSDNYGKVQNVCRHRSAEKNTRVFMIVCNAEAIRRGSELFVPQCADRVRSHCTARWNQG